jgi:hypothetical protein
MVRVVKSEKKWKITAPIESHRLFGCVYSALLRTGFVHDRPLTAPTADYELRPKDW